MKTKAYNMRLSSNKGFTLIEVMISAVILFSALAITAELFKASSFSADKAARSAKFYQIHPAAISAIRLSLKEVAHNNPATNFTDEVMLFGINYHWQAELQSLLSPAAQGDESPGEPRFALYQVQVLAKKANKEQRFSFQVATW
jgi:prepilin-type N-terminal cleavage/methylation domain-containing protein